MNLYARIAPRQTTYIYHPRMWNTRWQLIERHNTNVKRDEIEKKTEGHRRSWLSSHLVRLSKAILGTRSCMGDGLKVGTFQGIFRCWEKFLNICKRQKRSLGKFLPGLSLCQTTSYGQKGSLLKPKKNKKNCPRLWSSTITFLLSSMIVTATQLMMYQREILLVSQFIQPARSQAHKAKWFLIDIFNFPLNYIHIHHLYSRHMPYIFQYSILAWFLVNTENQWLSTLYHKITININSLTLLLNT